MHKMNTYPRPVAKSNGNTPIEPATTFKTRALGAFAREPSTQSLRPEEPRAAETRSPYTRDSS